MAPGPALICLTVVILISQTRADSDSDLTALADDFFNWRVRDSPEYGTAYGVHDYDDRLEDLSENAFTLRCANATAFITRANTIARDQLSTQNKISLDLLKYACQTLLDGYEYRRFGVYNFFTTLERPTDEWEVIVAGMNFNTEADYRKLLSRLSALPNQLAQMRFLMSEAIRLGTTVHNVSLTGAVTSLQTMINTSASSLFEPFTRIPATIDSAIRDQLLNESDALARNLVVPAWQAMLDFIVNTYAPNTRPGIGVTSLPGGAAYYQACLKWHTSTDLTPQEIHDIGLQEVARIKTEMENIMVKEQFSGTIRQYIDYLNSQSSNFFSTSDELLTEYRRIIDETHGHLLEVLLKVPPGDLVVVESTNPEGAGGSYRSPPLDLSRPGQFIVSVFHPETEAKYDMFALTLHEAEPGHHTQASYAIDFNMASFRRAIEDRKYNSIPFHWPLNTAYVEGWALYAESLGEEITNAYPDNKALFGRYASEIFRACRLVIDTGMHALGMTKAEALEYFLEHTTGSAESQETELNRYISWPGQATAYKIGELKIKELRKKAENALGVRFDKKQFHDQVLQLGAAPLSILESHINDWIATSTSPSPSPSPSPSASNNLKPAVFFCITFLVAKLF